MNFVDVQVVASIGATITRAKVTQTDGFDLVVEHVADEWVPQYALRPDGERVELPQCFSLAGNIVERLEREQERMNARV
jgi:hypothetical protein